jgi:hypothetical protein
MLFQVWKVHTPALSVREVQVSLEATASIIQALLDPNSAIAPLATLV